LPTRSGSIDIRLSSTREMITVVNRRCHKPAPSLRLFGVNDRNRQLSTKHANAGRTKWKADWPTLDGNRNGVATNQFPGGSCTPMKPSAFYGALFRQLSAATIFECSGTWTLRPGGLVLVASISSGARVRTPLKVRRWASTLVARCAIRRCVFGCAWPR